MYRIHYSKGCVNSCCRSIKSKFSYIRIMISRSHSRISGVYSHARERAGVQRTPAGNQRSIPLGKRRVIFIRNTIRLNSQSSRVEFTDIKFIYIYYHNQTAISINIFNKELKIDIIHNNGGESAYYRLAIGFDLYTPVAVRMRALEEQISTSSVVFGLYSVF